MNVNFRNPAIIAATVVLAIAAVIFGSALFADSQAPAATGGCGMHQGSSQSGQGCSMMGGSGSQGCSMSKGDGMMGTMNCGSGCTMLSGKVTSVGRDGTLTVRVKPAANTPDAARKAISQLRSGDNVSMMMMTGSGTTNGTTQKAAQYTCPMHPEVTSDKPGQCPKCGMNLEPVNPQSK